MPCYPPCQETNTGNQNPCYGTFNGCLPIFCQTTATSRPRECSLDTPSSWWKNEPLGFVRALDNLQCPFSLQGQSIPKLWPCISCVRKDVPQPREADAQCFENIHSTIPILYIGGVNKDRQQETLRVCHDVTLAPFDLFARIKA